MSTFTSNSEEIDKSVDVSFEKKVLSEVRKAKSLYCSNDPNYNNMAKNRLQWLMIAEKCNKTVSECVKIWHSLLRIYFSSSPPTSWEHNEEFLAFEPYLSSHKLHTPSKSQRKQLLKELWNNSSDLHKPECTAEERQNIWFKIVAKCNSITPGVIMSNINWQKYWLFMKQDLGERLYVVRSRTFEKCINYKDKYTEEEIMIIQICQRQPWEPAADIIIALGNNSELGINKELFLLRCKKCLVQREEILYNGFCSNCCEKPIFCSICEIGGASVKYKLADWSKQALCLLPTELKSLEEISLCFQCSDEINKKASFEWKICRVCESNKESALESLYNNCKASLAFRKAFMETINYEFQEKDGLPGYICSICKEQINKINQYIEKFKETQSRLMYIHKTNFIGTTEGTPLKQSGQQKVQGNVDEAIIIPYKIKYPGIFNKPAVAEKQKVQGNADEAIIIPYKRKQPGIINKPALAEKPKVVKTYYQKRTLMYSEKPESNQIIQPTVDTLAIKDVFSLQQGNQHKRTQQSATVLPDTVPQPGKLDSSRTLNASKAVSQPLKLNPKLNNTSLSEPKTLSIFPKSTFIGKPKKFITLVRKPEANITMKLKPTTASKPAIFTIPIDAPLASPEPVAAPIATDYETIEDAPPVFCIPKNFIKADNLPTDADKELMDFTPSPSKVIKIEKPDDDHDNPSPSKVIKIEKPDDDHDYYPAKDIPTTSNFSLVESTENPQTPTEEYNSNESSNLNPNNTKIVRIKGELVTIKPHPYLPGMYVPIVYHGKKQTSGTGGSIQMKPPVIRKVNPAKNTMHIAKPINISQKIPAKIQCNTAEQQVIKPMRKAKPINISHKIPAKIQCNTAEQQKLEDIGAIMMDVKSAKNTMYIAKPIIISQKIPAKIQCNTAEQQKLEDIGAIMMDVKSDHRQRIQKPRRYWGNVDGFQVAQSTANTIRLVDKSGGCTSSEDPGIQNLANVKIKEEFPYKDDTSNLLASNQSQNSILDSNTTNDTLSKHLKLISSFKLKKLSITIRRDKRIQMMSSECKELCVMQSVEEKGPLLSTQAVSFRSGRPRVSTYRKTKSKTIE